MSDLISRSAAMNIIHDLQTVAGWSNGIHEMDIHKALLKIPAVDAVQVIRCKDCIHLTRSPWGHPALGWCKLQGHHRKPDYYCASGRRKE